jgi:hypothetical protein
MKYRYEIHNINYVRETREDDKFLIWSISSLQSDLQPNPDYSEAISSFYRTKRWLQENHPEYLL